MFEFSVFAASSRPCAIYASDATLSFDVVKISLMQLIAWTCGKRLSSMLVCCASTEASLIRSFIARANSFPPASGSAAMMLAISVGMPADLRVIAPALSCIDRRVSCYVASDHITILRRNTHLIPGFWQCLKPRDLRGCATATEGRKSLGDCRVRTTMAKLQ